METRTTLAESIERIIARTIALNSAGEGLVLIGGFRYRLLDESPRFSADIDYHWKGDLEQKREELILLFGRRLLPEVQRKLGFDGTVGKGSGPEESIFVKSIDLAFYRLQSGMGRIEIPVDLTTIECMDRPIVRTQGGVVYLTASDTDLVESKVISVVSRAFLAHRDLIDIFLFQSAFAVDSAGRIASKMSRMKIGRDVIDRFLPTFEEGRVFHVKSIRGILQSQVAEPVQRTIESAGGAEMVFDTVVGHLRRHLESNERIPRSSYP